MQKKATVRSSVLEVLLEITKFCDLYLMERVLDDESEVYIKLSVAYQCVMTLKFCFPWTFYSSIMLCASVCVRNFFFLKLNSLNIFS